jgi:hypothetical protein
METQVEKLYSDIKHYNDSFKRLRYESAFEAYLYENRQCLNELRNKMDTYDSPEKAISRMSKQFVSKVAISFSDKQGNPPSWETQLSLNVFTTSYVLPAMLSMDSSLMKQLAEEICSCWRKTFKKSNISCATFQQLSEGFKNKPCYITTAICQSQGKADDCYELQLLRGYRDGYLSRVPGGEELISQYYEMAPKIVQAIDLLPNHDEVYTSIYEKQLLPCIKLIKEGKMEDTMKAYKAMAEALYKEYVL